MKVFVICILLVGIVVLIIAHIIILKKKGLIYKYIEKTKQLTAFDYVGQYDGNWLFADIDYDQIICDNESESQYILSEKKEITLLSRILICLIIFLVGFCSIFKIIESV